MRTSLTRLAPFSRLAIRCTPLAGRIITIIITATRRASGAPDRSTPNYAHRAPIAPPPSGGVFCFWTHFEDGCADNRLYEIRRPGAGSHSGRRERRSADGGVHERGGAREDAGNRVRHVLQPHARKIVDQRRDVWEQAVGAAHPDRLRPGYAAAEGDAPGRRQCVPHRRADVLL